MIISFDLDDTLISAIFDTEKQSIIQKILGLEKIRYGTIELFKKLKSEGHTIYIYTTSFRSTIKTKLTFLIYGISINKVINQEVHDRTLKEKKTRTSKFPPAFNIDIHIDDSLGLKIEGERYNFKTIIVKVNDENWVDTILNEIHSDM